MFVDSRLSPLTKCRDPTDSELAVVIRADLDMRAGGKIHRKRDIVEMQLLKPDWASRHEDTWADHHRYAGHLLPQFARDVRYLELVRKPSF